MAAPHSDLHELVDRLTPEQAEALRALVRHLVGAGEKESPAGESSGGRRVRRLSFAGTLQSGRDDLAARSEEIIRAELGNAA
jgi:hypothetical protein